ncbi:hypothetical protein BGY98DRAFT_933386 [Russula aff. rugulosa BPL654]|nr:hypothetical protein BGY98DRAFT_933386 [Russula aff. rugulosa BPL654]
MNPTTTQVPVSEAKHSHPTQNLYARATRAELARDLDTAFRLYVEAGGAFLNEQARQDAARALERAERIKAVKRDVAPVWRDPFALEEQQLVLKRGSVINGVAAPLWTTPVFGGAGTLFSDPDGLLELSAEQKEAGVVWRRPSEVFASAKILLSDLRPEDIAQRTALPSLFPRDLDGNPCLSPTGRYELKVLFNGAHRRVAIHCGPPPVVDDLLPFRSNNTRMCMTSRGERDIWPSLVEKAYLKLMGGYNFPGSNSSADIHALAGWIPDYLEVKSPSFQREQIWSRISRGFNDVGTDDRPVIDRGRVKLLPSHCYPVIDIKEMEGGSRWLTILDSWLPTDDITEFDALLDELSLNDGRGNQRRSIDIAWDDACTLFGSVCISWNPVMFKNRLIYHGSEFGEPLIYHRQDEMNSLRLILERPKDSERSSEEVSILLTRHRIDTRRSSEYISFHAEYDDDHPNTPKNITDFAKTQGIYTDNPHVLVRVTVPSSNASGTISLNLSYDGPFDGIGFTVTAYSGLGMRWDGPLRALPFDHRISGTLTSKTSGGNYTLPTYMINPQYCLRVPATTQDGPSGKTRVKASLHAPRDLPINVVVTWGRGKRVFDLAQSDIIATSGAYTYGFARLSADLPQGDFTLVVSAFSPTHLGEFSLLVGSSRWVEVDPIPQEGAGMFAKTMRGEWTNATHPRYSLELPIPTDVKIRLQPHALAFVRVGVFPVTGGTAVASSGAFTDARSGAATAQVALRAGQYIIEPEVDGPVADYTFSLTVYYKSAGISLAPL